MESDVFCKVNQIINPHFKSNTYVIYNDQNDLAVIIDPGDTDSKSLINFLLKKNIKNYNVILTHEHYDHISGLHQLCSLFDINLFLSISCFQNLNNPKKNLTEYLDVEILDSLTPRSFHIVYDNETKNIGDYFFKFFYTPGHSEGSMCIGLNNAIFTGDTLIENHKTITNLPGGDRYLYKKTKIKLDELLIDYEIVYPGHGSVIKNNL
jgi:hydroxyacylglutathione hydrolase